MFSAGFLGGNRNGGAVHRLSVALLGPWVDFPLQVHSRVYWKHPNSCCHQHVHCLNLQCLLQKSPSAINYQKKMNIWKYGKSSNILTNYQKRSNKSSMHQTSSNSSNKHLKNPWKQASHPKKTSKNSSNIPPKSWKKSSKESRPAATGHATAASSDRKRKSRTRQGSTGPSWSWCAEENMKMHLTWFNMI